MNDHYKDLWMKVKAIGEIRHNGEEFKTEIHWYEEPTIGKVEFKVPDHD